MRDPSVGHVPLFFYREDLACRLPEMEQPGSDQENLDSETSQSSESLLDELQRSSVHSSEPDGQYQVSQLEFLSFCLFLLTALWVF